MIAKLDMLKYDAWKAMRTHYRAMKDLRGWKMMGISQRGRWADTVEKIVRK